MKKICWLVTLLAAAYAASPDAVAQRPPVIDVHLHAYAEWPRSVPPDMVPRKEARALTASADAYTHLRATLAEMDRYNVVLGVVTGRESAVRAWHKAAPGRFVGGAFSGKDGLPEHSVEQLQRLVEEGVVGVLGELPLQYFGLTADDSRLAPYYEYLEKSGVPLALHTGLGPARTPHTSHPRFRVTPGRPTLLEPVIALRPKLRANLMHAGWPYVEETIAMMSMYPNLYADIGVLAWGIPLGSFHSTLRALLDAELGDRLLFGTDQMYWPGAIGMAIESVEAVPFLSDKQKRDILYNNAARFLRLTDKQIASHHHAEKPRDN